MMNRSTATTHESPCLSTFLPVKKRIPLPPPAADEIRLDAFTLDCRQQLHLLFLRTLALKTLPGGLELPPQLGNSPQAKSESFGHLRCGFPGGQALGDRSFPLGQQLKPPGKVAAK